MNRRGVLFGGLVVLFLTGSASLARGGAVYTSDGSKLVGTIERWADGKLVIVTEFAGRVEVDATKVVAVASAEPVTVQFDSGDRLVGTMTVDDTSGTCVMETALGPLNVQAGKVVAVWKAGDESPEVLAVRAETEKVRKALTPVWTLKIEAGGNMTEGNTDTLDARGRLDVNRKTQEDLLQFFLAAKYNERDDRRTTNEYRGGVNYENQITDRAYWYTRMEMEFDEFENLDLRATAAAGVGYYWLKREDHEYKTRLGLGYRHESFDNGASRDQGVIDLGMDYRLDVAPWMQFVHSSTYSPAFEEFDDYRLSVDTALLFPLKSEHLKLKLGMQNEYNSRPQRGIDRLDNTYYANLVFELTR